MQPVTSDSSHPPERFPLVLEIADAADLAAEPFARWVTFAHQALSSLASDAGLPVMRATAVLTGDFAGAAREAVALGPRADGSVGYSAERLGGKAVAKTIALTDDFSDVRILFDSAAWRARGPEDLGLFGLYLVAHELTHAFVGRLRAESGAFVGVHLPSKTPAECARSIARASAEEFLADIVAGTVLGVAASISVDGQSRPLRKSDLADGPGGYASQLGLVLDDHVHPGWPDLVQRYRDHRLGLDVMWRRIVEDTDQVMTLIAHAEAEAAMDEAPGPMAGQYSGHPGVALYLAPAWTAIRQAMQVTVLFPPPEEFRASEAQITNAGEDALLAMWGRLGLTSEVRAGREFAIWVSEPQR